MISSLSEQRAPLQVLLVDDDDKMLRTIGDILALRGYATVPAQSGRAGLSLVEDMPIGPAIALVDLRLPDMDGIELIGRLHEMSELTQVVILTGNASVESAVRALREESYDYLIKPVAPDQLLNSMDRAGDRWQRRRAEVALAESESRLRRVFDCVSDGLFVTDKQGRITDANAAALHLTDRALHDLNNRSFVDLLSSARGGELGSLRNVTQPLAEPGEYRITRRDGGVRTVDVVTSGLTSDLQVYTVRDLTVQRGLEEQLSQAQKMEAIGRLAGGVAHDFNNMLTAIIAYAELLKIRFEGEGRPEEVDEIIKAGRRAAQLTSQLLAFGRKTMMQQRIVALGEIVADIENMMTRLIGENVHLVTVNGDAVPNVLADSGQLGQVVMNLVVNARDAMPSGGTLTIRTDRVVLEERRVHAHGVIPPGTYAQLTVSDTGTGMSASTIAHIFEPFYTTKEAGKGTGLGLSTTYGIVSQSGGHVEVESDEGQGTSFRIYLPGVDRVSAGLTPPRGLRAVGRQSGTILVAEDEPSVRELVARILRSAGYTVVVAQGGEDALRLANEHKGAIDLLVTDVAMPGMTGPELVDRLRARNQHLAVLYMSGYANTQASQPSVEEVGVNLLQKPFTAKELTDAVAECIGRPA